MKQHTRMEAHDGYLPHSHEVRPDHLGVHRSPVLVAEDARKVTGIDRYGIPMPDGWAVYFDGELVFSAGEDKWREIGPGIEKIMEG